MTDTTGTARRGSPWTSVLAAATVCVTAAACASAGAQSRTGTTGADPLGSRPTLPAPADYRAPAPRMFTTRQGLTVWWVPRSELPIVSVALAVPYGSAQDPADKPGLAFITAEMLDEGAGERDALGIGGAVADLGTSLSIDVSRDGSRIAFRVLRRNLDDALALLGDLVTRPRFDRTEWQRTLTLWRAYLESRGDDPVAAAGIVGRAALYGRSTPYGHPSRGHPEGAERIELADVRQFHRRHWRPDRALLVVAGDIDEPSLRTAVTRAFGAWQAPQEPAPPRVESPGPQGQRPRLVLVDQPKAPQSVVLLIRPGVSAAHPDAALLPLVNTALGGSFTSRLNQILREDKGWTYAVESAFFETRGVGPFLVIASVEKRVTAAAIGRALRELDRLAAGGLTTGEFVKVRAQDRTSFMDTYETSEGTARRLSALSTLGLSPDFDTLASRQRRAASNAELTAVAQRHLDTGQMTVVVVGPAAELTDQLELLELGPPEPYSANGRKLAADEPPQPDEPPHRSGT